MRRSRAWLPFLLALAPANAAAQDGGSGAPALCEAGTQGQLSCQANRQCVCVHAQAVPARNLPDRWHWDCGIARPSCEVVSESLAPLPHHSGSLPVIVDIDEDRRTGRNRPPPDRDPPRD